MRAASTNPELAAVGRFVLELTARSRDRYLRARWEARDNYWRVTVHPAELAHEQTTRGATLELALERALQRLLGLQPRPPHYIGEAADAG